MRPSTFPACRHTNAHSRLAANFIAEDDNRVTAPSAARYDGLHLRLHAGQFGDIDAWAALAGQSFPVRLVDLIDEDPPNLSTQRMLRKRQRRSGPR